MSYKSLIVFPFLSILLTACGSMPKTPELLLENANSGSMFSEKETFEVNRPIAQVAEVLKKKAQECLQQEVTTVSTDSNGGIRTQHRHVSALTPKVRADKQRTRLTLQVKTKEGATDLGDIPPDGWYMMVVDAYPLGNRTRIESYYQYTSFHGAYTAIKPWVTGANMGCPDLTL